MTTSARIRRGLLARVPGILDVTITNERPPVANILVPPNATAELQGEARAALQSVVAAGLMVEPNFVEHRVEGSPSPEGPYLLANIAAANSGDGIIRTVKRLIPEVARVIVGDWEGDSFEIRVADIDGKCSEALLIKASRAVSAAMAIGVKFHVSPLRSTDRTASHEDFPSASRKNIRLREIATEDEERFAKRLGTLVYSAVAERIPCIDDLQGERICTTIGGPDAATVGTFLPVYDHILLLLVPDAGDPADYYRRNYGVSEDVLLAYVRAGKIVPVFKFELGCYPEAVWRRFLEDPSLPFVTARDLDYLCARSIWNSSGWLRGLRADRVATAVLHRVHSKLAEDMSPKGRYLANVYRFLLQGAEAFEGDMWWRGHLAASDYSPALPLIELLRVFARDDSSKSMGVIEAHGAAMHLAIGQALGAATHEGLVSNEGLLLRVAELFGGEAPSLFTWAQGTRLSEVLQGLELSFSEEIPPDEYLNIFEEANTKRIRALVAQLIQRQDRHSELELRELIQGLNKGVARIAGSSLEKADVSLVATSAGKALGAPFLSTVLEAGGNIGGKFGRFVDARIGTAIDHVRGWINQVPAQSIRLYKIRRRLKSAKRLRAIK